MTGPETVNAAQSDRAGSHVRNCTIITVTCLTLYLAGNGRVSLWDRDEAWYAQTAREMVTRGNYVVPQFNGQPRYRKPVLIYWLMASAYGVFGDNEFAARLFSGIAGTVTCLCTYRLGCRMIGRTAGVCAGLMLAVAPFMVLESKLATTDAVLTALITAAMLCLWEIQSAGFSWCWSVGFWTLIGAMVMTKGPFGPAFLALATLIGLMLSRRWGTLRQLNWAVGVAIVLAICLPWGLAIYFATGGEFYRVAVGEQAIGHSFSAMNHHRQFPGMYLLLALGGLFPWTLTLSSAFAGFRQWVRGFGPGSFLIGWMFGPLIMLELMRTKLPQYYLPAFPAWSLLIARGIVGSRETVGYIVNSIAGLRRVVILGGSCVVIAIGLGGMAIVKLPSDLQVPTLGIAAALCCGSVLAVGFMLRRHDSLGWGTLVGTWWTMAFIMAVAFLPTFDRYRIAHLAAEALRDAAGMDGSQVVLAGYREPSLVFYLGRPVPTFAGPKDLGQYVRSNGPVLTLLRDAEVKKFEQVGLVVNSSQRINARSIPGLATPSVSLVRIVTPSDVVSVARGAEASPESDPARR